MARFYRVTVQNIYDTTLTLDIQIIDPMTWGIPSTVGFALQVIENMSFLTNESVQLSTYVSKDNLFDTQWMVKNARRFINSVQLNLYAPEVGAEFDSEEARNLNVKGTMIIMVTDSAWISHLKEGDVYDSYAYDEIEEYEDCAPQVYGEPSDSFTKFIAGKYPFWSYMMGDMASNNGDMYAWIPMYPDSCYKEISSHDPASDIDKILGNIVRIENKQGLLLKGKAENLYLVSIVNNAFEYEVLGAELLQNSIALLLFEESLSTDKNKYDLNKLAASCKPNIDVPYFNINERELEFEVLSFSKNWPVNIKNIADVTALLLAPATNHLGILAASCTLARTIQDIIEKEALTIKEACIKASPLIIEQYSVEVTNEVTSFPDFYSVTENDCADIYSPNLWPSFLIKLKVTDKKWIDHLELSDSFNYTFPEN